MASEKTYRCFCLICGKPFQARGANARYCPSCKQRLLRQRPGLPMAERLRLARRELGILSEQEGNARCAHCLARDARNTQQIVCAFGRCVKEELRF